MDSTSPPRGDKRRGGEEAARGAKRDGRKRERSDGQKEKKKKGRKAGGDDDGKGSRQRDTNKRNRERIKGHYFGAKERERDGQREREIGSQSPKGIRFARR